MLQHTTYYNDCHNDIVCNVLRIVSNKANNGTKRMRGNDYSNESEKEPKLEEKAKRNNT